jgi:hypothetical protein
VHNRDFDGDDDMHDEQGFGRGHISFGQGGQRIIFLGNNDHSPDEDDEMDDEDEHKDLESQVPVGLTESTETKPNAQRESTPEPEESKTSAKGTPIKSKATIEADLDEKSTAEVVGNATKSS